MDTQYQKDLTAILAGTICSAVIGVSVVVCIGYICYKVTLRRIKRNYVLMHSAHDKTSPLLTPGKLPTLEGYFTAFEKDEKKIFWTEVPIIEQITVDLGEEVDILQRKSEESTGVAKEKCLLNSPVKVPILYDDSDTGDAERNSTLDLNVDNYQTIRNTEGLEPDFTRVNADKYDEGTNSSSDDNDDWFRHPSGNTLLQPSDTDGDPNCNNIGLPDNYKHRRKSLPLEQDEYVEDNKHEYGYETTRSSSVKLYTSSFLKTIVAEMETPDVTGNENNNNEPRVQKKGVPSMSYKRIARRFSLKSRDYDRSLQARRTLASLAKMRFVRLLKTKVEPNMERRNVKSSTRILKRHDTVVGVRPPRVVKSADQRQCQDKHKTHSFPNSVLKKGTVAPVESETTADKNYNYSPHSKQKSSSGGRSGSKIERKESVRSFKIKQSVSPLRRPRSGKSVASVSLSRCSSTYFRSRGSSVSATLSVADIKLK